MKPISRSKIDWLATMSRRLNHMLRTSTLETAHPFGGLIGATVEAIRQNVPGREYYLQACRRAWNALPEAERRRIMNMPLSNLLDGSDPSPAVPDTLPEDLGDE